MGESGITRRQFLKAAALTIGFGSGAGLLIKKVLGPELDRLSAAERVKRFESYVGARSLTFEEAKAFVPLVADLYTKNRPGKMTSAELVNNTYIARLHYDKPETQEEQAVSLTHPNGNPVADKDIRRFLLDNPNAKFSEVEVVQIVIHSPNLARSSYGFELDRNIFLYFDRLNDPYIDYYPDEPRPPKLQFDSLDSTTGGKPEIPVVRWRHLFLHEMSHIDSNGRSRQVSPEFLQLLKKSNPDLAEIIKHGISENFSLKLNADPNDIVPLNYYRDLNELVTDYLTVSLSEENKLPFILTHGMNPIDLNNFRKVIKQAGISEYELSVLYDDDRLEDFLLKVAQGAKNIKFKDRSEALDFGLKHFVTRKDADIFIDWSGLKTFYPDIDIPAQTTKKAYHPANKKLPQGAFF